ncbi:hypothetical protein Y032_0046g1402 [Ancylostoma ceylanicum]|uniref:aralkylamine N-acetyltransferase n=1 Tax=Ancylostoma ceylanicum TaxID=53326 RepID=A0A016UDR5_9BILA|nr:hypothetical protein Y032_0046g1402 [Ancylostoma ceylanicum]
MSNNLRSCLLKVHRDAVALRQLRNGMRTLSFAAENEPLILKKGGGNGLSTSLQRQQRQPWHQLRRSFATTSDNLRIDVATRKHAKDVEKYLNEEFSANEPISRSLGLTKDDACDFFHDLADNGLSHEKYSSVVYDKDRLVALLLCAVKNHAADEAPIPPEIDAEHHDFAEEISKGPYKNRKANQLFTYVYAIEHRQKRLLGDKSKVFKLDILGVHRDYRGRGLGKKLTERALEIARTDGCQFVATAATAMASQGIFTKMGFQTLYDIPYAVFRENGKAVFQNLHDGCKGGKFMVLRL